VPFGVGACTFYFLAIGVDIRPFRDKAAPPWFLDEEDGGVAGLKEGCECGVLAVHVCQ
jgi:hypothetical protein